MAYTLTTEKSWSETDRAVRETFRKWGVDHFEILAELRGVQAARWNQSPEQAEVAVNFIHPESGQQIPITSRNQSRAVDNFRVVYLALEAIRMNEQRGIADVVREAYMALPAPKRERDPFEVLGIRSGEPIEIAEAAFKAKAKLLHPDINPTDGEAMKELNAAIAKVRGQP